MVMAYLDKWKTYEKLLPAMSSIIRLAEEAEDKKAGKYETEWGFYLIQEGMTKAAEDVAFECHRDYLDVQCLIKGKEYLEWQDIGRLKSQIPYSKEKDLEILDGKGDLIEITPGMFYIMFPEDGHKAGLHQKVSVPYKKFVAKVKI